MDATAEGGQHTIPPLSFKCEAFEAQRVSPGTQSSILAGTQAHEFPQSSSLLVWGTPWFCETQRSFCSWRLRCGQSAEKDPPGVRNQCHRQPEPQDQDQPWWHDRGRDVSRLEGIFPGMLFINLSILQFLRPQKECTTPWRSPPVMQTGQQGIMK